jgi:hypothetical protein
MDSRSKILIVVPKHIHDALRDVAGSEMLSVSDLVRQGVKLILEKHKAMPSAPPSKGAASAQPQSGNKSLLERIEQDKRLRKAGGLDQALGYTATGAPVEWGGDIDAIVYE